MRTPSWLMAWIQTLRRSGVKSTVTKTKREQAKNLARQKLVQQEMRHLLLQEKELANQLQALEHRLEELTPKPEPELLVVMDNPPRLVPESLLQPELLKLDRPDNPALPLLEWLGSTTPPQSSRSSD